MRLQHILLGALFCLLISFFACQAPSPAETTAESIAVKSSIPQVDTSLFETFKHTDGDTTYLMKKYYMVFLKAGPTRDQDKATAASIQAAHLAHMSRLAEEKKIVSAGPFDDDSDIRGIVIYSVSSLEEAHELTSQDPAVKAGRLAVEVHPWWAAVGTVLF